MPPKVTRTPPGTVKRDITLPKLPPRLTRPPTKPVWQGPIQEGVTQSLISGWLCCRERFRVKTILGLAEAESFKISTEYGNLWHACEEEYASQPLEMTYDLMYQTCKGLQAKYPLQRKEIQHWASLCEIQFPIYTEYWANYDMNRDVEPLYQEESFKIPYTLPSGRVVYLKGKFDRVDQLSKGRGVRLGEHKTKSKVDTKTLERQLANDLQVMTYCSALTALGHNPTSVLYNVVKRPLSGGKGTIRQRKATKTTKAETLQEYYDRLQGILWECPDQYFNRFEVGVTPGAIKRFKTQSLHPILENICDDYEWWSWCLSNRHDHFDYETRSDEFPAHQLRHYRLPYGVYNTILEGGTGSLDAYLDSGTVVGLRRVTTISPELAPTK